ncbi:MAG: glycosyltransferase [archaeon]
MRCEKGLFVMLGTLDVLEGLWNAIYPFLTLFNVKVRFVFDYVHVYFTDLFQVFLYVTAAFTLVYLILFLIVNLSKKKDNEKPFIPEKAPFVTVQIPTRNEIIALRCAKRCLAFDYPEDKFEILIGDDSNDVSVSRELDEFASQYPGKVMVVRRAENIGFKPGNLNNMLDHSRGDVLVIFDSDFTPEPDFLKRIVAPFIHDESVSAVQAKWNFNNFNQNAVTVLASIIVYSFHHAMLSFINLFGAGSLCGSAEAIKKKDLIELGRWRSGSLTEDIECTMRLYKNNKKIVYMPKLECYSDVPYVPADLYKQQMRWAYGVVNAYKLHLKDILLSRSLSLKKKLISLSSGFGYVMPVFMFLLFVLGSLSFITHKPDVINILKFLFELLFNILLTSGLLFLSLLVLYKERKLGYAFKMILSSFSIGIVTSYYVNKGIFKSAFNKPMQWYLLNKKKEY